MNICFIPTLNAPVVYYRMENFVHQLRKMGHTVGFSYWGPNFTETCQWEQKLKLGEVNKFIETINDSAYHSDVIIFQCLHYQIGLSVLMALQDAYSRKPFLAEFDDDIYSVHSLSPSFNWTGPGTNVEWIGNKQLEVSNGVVVSTEYLKKQYNHKNSRIEVIPNAIDFNIWEALEKPKENLKQVKIGWEGGANHEINLRLIKNVVPKILDKFPNVVFHFKYGGYPLEWLKHERIIFDDYHKWVPINKHPQSLKKAGFDIGIAPLRDLDFNRAKSNLRWLEYSALKIPTVASDVEPYRCIEHGKTGFLAKEKEDWIKYLSDLITSEELRKHVGDMAYRNVRENYNIEKVSKKYLEILEKFT